MHRRRVAVNPVVFLCYFAVLADAWFVEKSKEFNAVDTGMQRNSPEQRETTSARVAGATPRGGQQRQWPSF